MSGVEERADDYERRLAEAGGPDAVLSGLVVQFNKQKRLFRLAVVGLIADIVLSIILGIFGLVTYDTVHRVDGNSEDITTARNQLNRDVAVFNVKTAAFNAQIACQQRNFAETITALRANGQFATQQAIVSLSLDRAQETLQKALAKAGPGDVQAEAWARRAFLKVLGFDITATQDSLKVIETHPFPSITDVQSCRE